MTTELNGWNVEAMTEAIEEVKKTPEAGRLTWRGRVEWDGGFGLDVHTREIEQMGEVMHRHFTLRGDHPPELLGKNTGPTAIETYLAALGACMAGTFAAQATARDVKVEKLQLEVSGNIDLNGFFGLAPVRPGLSNVKLEFSVDAEADDATLAEILEAAQTHSPIFDTTTKPVKVQATVRRADQ
ncbi:MAG: OsmC family protein [Myxococcales bacterium]|nr:OsmC family protein [Myxococcales bacterium]MCB9582261.1 OsmC family protein [Polyangiaceae bacterium]